MPSGEPRQREWESTIQSTWTAEPKTGTKSRGALVFLVSDELGKHIWQYVADTGVMVAHQGVGGRCFAFCEPRYTNAILGLVGRAFSLPFSFARQVIGVATALVYIHSDSFCGMEPFSLLTLVSLVPSPHQKMPALLGLVLSKTNILPCPWTCCSFIKQIHEMADIFQGRWRRLSIL